MPLVFSRRQFVQNFLYDEDMLAWLFIFHEVIFKTSPSHQPLTPQQMWAASLHHRLVSLVP